MKRPALQNERVVVLRMAFRARKVFGTFEKRAPGLGFETRLKWANERLKGDENLRFLTVVGIGALEIRATLSVVKSSSEMDW